MIWLIFAAMSLAAIAFVVWPLTRDLPRQGAITALSIVLVVGLTAGLYYRLGSPDLPSGASEAPDVNAMVQSLAERLEREPDNVQGWTMLGRSYMTLGNHTGAAAAYRKAVELESAQNPATLVALGVAVVESNGRQFNREAIAVFENALALEPNNPDALFWGGIGAFNNGDAELAADRWETLLATDPPDDIRNILVERIAVWRGEPAPAPAASPAAELDGDVVTAEVSLSNAARNAIPGDAMLFLIARDPAQPSPPIAVTRRSVAELPASISLGDRESMIPGRNLSAFAEFEMIARVSLSGSPAAQAGDWFASVIVRPADADGNVSMVIDQVVE